MCVSLLLSLPCEYGALYLVDRVSMIGDYTVDKSGSLATPSYSEETKQPLLRTRVFIEKTFGTSLGH